MTPTVSIILPTYNREKFLPEAFAAIAEQTFTDWELIVVDDGRTDGTRELVPRLSAGFAQPVSYIYQEDKAPLASRKQSAFRRWFGISDVMKSAEFRALARKALDTKPLGPPVQGILESAPALTDRLQRMLGGGGAEVYRPSDHADTPEIRITLRFAAISTTQAQTHLGYGPTVSGGEARELTLEWWREWKSR